MYNVKYTLYTCICTTFSSFTTLHIHIIHYRNEKSDFNRMIFKLHIGTYIPTIYLYTLKMGGTDTKKYSMKL